MSNGSTKSKRPLIVGAVVLAALVAGGLWLLLKGPKPATPGATPKPVAAGTGAGVKVEVREEPVIYKAVGTLRSRDQVELSPRIVARIVDISARSGDRVTKGQALFKLDDSDLSAAVAQARERVKGARTGVTGAQARVREAKAALDLTDQELKRAQELSSGTGVVSKAELDRAVSAQRRATEAWNQALEGQRGAEADLAGAEQALRQAEATLEFAVIRSPMDGLVAERLADPGDLASPGRILMRVFDPSRLMLEAPVRESLAPAVKLGAKAPIEIPALGRTFEGEVREIVPSVDAGSRTFLVKVCVGMDPALYPGMFGVLSLELGKEKALLAPEKLVSRTGQLEVVKVLREGREEKRLVRTAPAAGGMRRVLSGLEEGAVMVAP